VSDAELRALYAGARAFVCPSRHEGFGLPPLEAMALGAPVVCAAAASLPEVVGDAAVLFPAGNGEALAAALRSVLGDDMLRQRLRQAGRERAAQFTWQRTAAATVAVYGEALAHFRARRA
jgi:alpha-1,3-rhamnosyl/mannosyltransferase